MLLFYFDISQRTQGQALLEIFERDAGARAKFDAHGLARQNVEEIILETSVNWRRGQIDGAGELVGRYAHDIAVFAGLDARFKLRRGQR